MKKILIPFFIVLSINSLGKVIPVVEVGKNVTVNTLAKIEQARATLESIQQTKNQIIQLKNDALNLNKWSALVLNETLGITQQDIQNVLAIKRQSEALLNDARNLQKNWKSDMRIDYTKLDVNQIAKMNEKDKRIYEVLRGQKESFDERFKDDLDEAKKRQEKIARMVETFKNQNNAIQGNLEAMQLTNTILANLYDSMKQVDNTLVEQEKTRKLEEDIKAEREKRFEITQIKEEYERRARNKARINSARYQEYVL